MNKTLLKISGIVAVILGIFVCITIIGIIIGVPMIIGGNKFRAYAEMDEEDLIDVKESILMWSIIFLFICQLSGILGLIVYFQTFENRSNNTSKSENYLDELTRLKELYDNRVITKEEFETKKKTILER